MDKLTRTKKNVDVFSDIPIMRKRESVEENEYSYCLSNFVKNDSQELLHWKA